MTDNYTYPAIISENELGGKDIRFPDFNDATTCTSENVIETAQDFLALVISDYEDCKKNVPRVQQDYVLEEGQQLIYINVWMPYHRTKMKEVYVKKTLTIPAWLDVLAKENNVNFSAVLVKGLKEHLGLEKE